MKFIDDFLNRITMYRLTLYYLICLLAIAAVLGFAGIGAFSGIEIILASLFLVVVCVVANKIFARVFGAPENFESAYITALILALLIAPSLNLDNYIFLFWAGIIAIASKFILAVNKKHIFNPAAIAVVITAYAINHAAVWWVGSMNMLPAVVIGGFLIMRKIRREDMVYAFVAAALGLTLIDGMLRGSNLGLLLKEELAVSPLFFLAFVMLTEPATTPPTKTLQIIYAGIVAVLFSPQTHLGGFYFTPELALVAGNIFSYVVSPKRKLALQLSEKIQLSPDIYDFKFNLDKTMKYEPGQYMEFTLGHRADSRGNRRYFTLASSPTETDLRLGVKFYEPSSSFKQHLLQMGPKDQIVAGQLAGDFTLPKNSAEKLVFIAGGIGITPFRSMVKYLIDKKERRNIILFFSNTNAEEIVYEDIFTEAYEKLGTRTVYTLTENRPDGWQGESGRISAEMIQKYVPDYKERLFYISGTHQMVESLKQTLKTMGVAQRKIKVDFFPGYV